VVAAAITFALLWGGLLATHRQTKLAVPKAVAVQHVLADSLTGHMLASLHWDRYDVTPMDSRYEILGFYRGPRIVATVTVGFDGHVVILNSTDLTRAQYQYGSSAADNARVLAVLCAVFVLMCAVWPLWRIRNLDVLVLASLTLSIVFYNSGMLSRMILVTYSALPYLGFRCAWWALRGAREGRASVPLFDHVTRRWSAGQQVRALRLTAVATALIVAVVGLTSLNVLDVGYAVMEGATLISHGVLPYGHIPDVLHGDTYPLGSYLLYVPFALLSPVRNVWDDADLTLLVAVAAALLAALGLWRVAGRPATGGAGHGSREAERAGLRTAIAWLTFPPLIVTVTTGTTDVALAAILVGALVLWRRPAWSTALLSAAAWFKLVPLAILPLLLAGLRGRSLARSLAVIVMASAVMISILVALGGLAAPGRMLRAMSFQFTRGSQHSLWTLIGGAPVQELFEAATCALVLGAALRIRRDPALAGDFARLAGIAAAIMLGLQVSANYWSYLYLVWVFPFIALSLLSDRRGFGDGLAGSLHPLSVRGEKFVAQGLNSSASAADVGA